MKLPAPPLLVVTDRNQSRAPLQHIVAVVFAAGCRWVSLREKDLPPREQIALARLLLPIARAHDARLTLHGDPALAREAGVDGVHLSSGSDAAAARAVLGADALIGLSVHAGDDLAKLDPALDYVIAGPAYATPSKPGYGPLLGAAGIAALVAATPLPVVAVGGIDAGNAAGLMRAGASGVAVMGGVMRAARPEDEIRHLLAAIA